MVGARGAIFSLILLLTQGSLRMMHNPFSQTPPSLSQLFEQLKNGARQLKSEPFPQAPLWLQHGIQTRLVLLLNHVLQQDARAIEQLLAHQGKTIQAQWRNFSVCLRITPAGLTALESTPQTANLSIHISETNPLKIMHQSALGQRPAIHIHGDAELASTMHWLAENLRWNIQEDLAHIVGAPAAEHISTLARTLHKVLGEFIRKTSNTNPDNTAPAQPLPHQNLPQ